MERCVTDLNTLEPDIMIYNSIKCYGHLSYAVITNGVFCKLKYSTVDYNKFLISKYASNC